MNNNVLITGGCRSCKSSHALELAEKIGGEKRIFIATLNPQDQEMEGRVRRHRSERSDAWQTVETPLNLAEAVTTAGLSANVILIDCLTLWISNLLLKHDDLHILESKIKGLTDSLRKMPCPVFLVTNEVGTGIVPENRLARLFRDEAGFCNQQVAKICSKVIWMVAGIPVRVK